MLNGKDRLVDAIRAYEARQRVTEASDPLLGAKAKAAAAADEYFARVVRPSVAKLKGEAEGAGLPLAHVAGTLVRVEGGARIRETLAMLGSSPYGDTRASHVLIDWWGGGDVHVTGRIQNQLGSWPTKERGFVHVGAPSLKLERLIRECLVGILLEC